jgi:hypothetical protein
MRELTPEEYTMRELTPEETELVSGGASLQIHYDYTTGIGTGTGSFNKGNTGGGFYGGHGNLNTNFHYDF